MKEYSPFDASNPLNTNAAETQGANALGSFISKLRENTPELTLLEFVKF